MNENKVMREYLGQLIGQKVIRVVKDPSSDIGPIWGIQFDDDTVAFILCDPEGNGPGHLHIQKGE